MITIITKINVQTIYKWVVLWSWSMFDSWDAPWSISHCNANIITLKNKTRIFRVRVSLSKDIVGYHYVGIFEILCRWTPIDMMVDMMVETHPKWLIMIVKGWTHLWNYSHFTAIDMMVDMVVNPKLNCPMNIPLSHYDIPWFSMVTALYQLQVSQSHHLWQPHF